MKEIENEGQTTVALLELEQDLSRRTGEAIRFLTEALREFWLYHREGEPEIASRVLDLAADEEFELTLDCEVTGSISARMGYDDERFDALRFGETESTEHRRELLAEILVEHPHGL